MRLNEIVECADCMEIGVPTKHGHCPTCNSSAVRWIVGEQCFLLPEKRLEEIHLCGIDREFLREMGVKA